MILVKIQLTFYGIWLIYRNITIVMYSSAFNGNYTTILEYYYDESGIASFRYNGAYYYYLKNLQGDVICIIDNTGAVVVEYAYDAWGNNLSVTGSLASTVGQANPFRYRSYYYDTDFAFHYSFLRHLILDSGRNQRGEVKSVLHGFALFQSDYKVFDDTGGFLIRHGTDISHINNPGITRVVHISIGNGGVYGIEANDTCRQDKNGANCDTYMP